MAGANISLRRGGTFSRRKPGQRDFPPGKSPLSRERTGEMEFSFSKRLSLTTLCLVAFLVPFLLSSPLFHFDGTNTRIHRNTLPTTQRWSWRASSLQRTWNDRKVTHKAIRGGTRQAITRSNQRFPSSRVGGGGLFPLTRKIGLDNCRTTFPSSPLTLVCPSFFLEFPALVLTPPSLVSTIFPAKVCQEGKCGKFGKESGSRRTITKNPIILGRREDCNYRDYRIPEEANFSTLFNSCF